MTYFEPSFSVNVHVTNPGQFFACCGLLELAHRLWPGAEGWFDTSKSRFAFSSKVGSASLHELREKLVGCDITGLSEADRQERERLEEESRQLKEQNKSLSEDKERKRKELGILAREGTIWLGEPFNIALNWWQADDDDASTPKTWAGRQEIHKVTRAAQEALTVVRNPEDLLNHGCVMHMPKEYRKCNGDQKKPVEPFYFDARRFAHALDTGFSLDVQDAETIAYPGVELLSLIGLQRFRPASSSNKWTYEYLAWTTPLSASVAPAAVCCAVASGPRYRFRLQFRDDQRRYKAFGFATPIGAQK
jgi:CRISPR-associated protein Csb3